jgi:hypothetical protein
MLKQIIDYLSSGKIMKREIEVKKGEQKAVFPVCNCMVAVSPKLMDLEDGKGFASKDGSYVVRDGNYLLFRNCNMDGRTVERLAVQADCIKPKTMVIGDSPVTEIWPEAESVVFKSYVN